MVRVPIRYLPNRLTKKDRKKQLGMIIKSKKLYLIAIFFKVDEIHVFESFLFAR
jgi:hypothetical protein